jgi:hypothetical protein
MSTAAHTAPADEPEAAEEATAAAAHAAFAEEEDLAEDAKATDWDGNDGGYESDGLGGISDEEHTDRGWGVYGPIAAAIDAGRKAGFWPEARDSGCNADRSAHMQPHASGERLPMPIVCSRHAFGPAAETT